MVGTFCTIMGISSFLVYVLVTQYTNRVYQDLKIALETDTFLLKERYTQKAIDTTYLNANIGVATCLARISILKQMSEEEKISKSVKQRILRTQLHECMDILSATTTQLVESELNAV